MENCKPACAECLESQFTERCGEFTIQQAGIPYLVMAMCSVLPSDYSDLDQWELFASQGLIRIYGEVVGSLQPIAWKKIKKSTCRPEQPTGGTATLAFQSHNVDGLGNQDRVWSQLMRKQGALYAGWFTCPGEFFGLYPFSLEVSRNIADNNDDNQFFDGNLVFQFNKAELPQPYAIPGLRELLMSWSGIECSNTAPIPPPTPDPDPDPEPVECVYPENMWAPGAFAGNQLSPLILAGSPLPPGAKLWKVTIHDFVPPDPPVPTYVYMTARFPVGLTCTYRSTSTLEQLAGQTYPSSFGTNLAIAIDNIPGITAYINYGGTAPLTAMTPAAITAIYVVGFGACDCSGSEAEIEITSPPPSGNIRYEVELVCCNTDDPS